MVNSHFGYKVDYSKPFVADDCELSVSKASSTVTHTLGDGDPADVVVINSPKVDFELDGLTTAAYATDSITINYPEGRADQLAIVQLGSYTGDGGPVLMATTALSTTRQGLDVTVTVRNDADKDSAATAFSASDVIPFSLVFL